MSIRIRKVEERDVRKIIKLKNRIFGSRMSKKKFYWKYYERIHDNRPLFVVVEDGREIVGGAGIFKIPLQYQGKKFYARQPTDIMIKEDYRDVRLFHKVVQKLRTVFSNNVSLEFGFPTSKSRNVWRRVEGWSFCSYELGYQLIRPSAFKLQSSKTWVEWLFFLIVAAHQNAALLLYKYVRNNLFGHEQLTVYKGYKHELFDENTDDRDTVRVQRSKTFWKWRARDPSLNIQTICIRHDKNNKDAALLINRPKGSFISSEIALVSSSDKLKNIVDKAYTIAVLKNKASEFKMPVPIHPPAKSFQTLSHGRWVNKLKKKADKDCHYMKRAINKVARARTQNTVGWKWVDRPSKTPLPPTKWEISSLITD